MATMFSKRHYVAIAECLKGNQPRMPHCKLSPGSYDNRQARIMHHRQIVEQLADCFEFDNRDFDRNQFLRAAGEEV